MELRDFFERYHKTAVAFSGGTDSAYLLYAAKSYGVNFTAYFVKSAFQPRFELEDAERMCEELGAPLRVLELDILSDPAIFTNPPDRCYYCKKRIFSAITEAANQDGYSVLLDGTNLSDETTDRPGMRALREFSVLSPLLECGLTKKDIRHLSENARLFTCDKPAYACLATRIPTGEEITADKLEKTESAEAFLASLGFTDFRIRMLGTAARIQLRPEQYPKLLERREEVLNELRYWYEAVLLDLEARI